jgi:hypothetical protein
MAARYWTLITDDLMDASPQWPPMLRPVERGGTERPGVWWWLIEDDDAPADLDGKKVDMTLTRLPGGMIAVERCPWPQPPTTTDQKAAEHG